MVEVGTTETAAIKLRLRRHKFGLKVSVKVWPEVEEFFKHWSGGTQVKPEHGRLWRVASNDPVALKAGVLLWGFGPQNMGPSSMRPYSLIHTGLGAMTDQGHPNISFLRLVGASSEEGRDIVIEAVLGAGEIATLGQRMTDACNMFYYEYIQPVNYRGMVLVEKLPSAA